MTLYDRAQRSDKSPGRTLLPDIAFASEGDRKRTEGFESVEDGELSDCCEHSRRHGSHGGNEESWAPHSSRLSYSIVVNVYVN